MAGDYSKRQRFNCTGDDGEVYVLVYTVKMLDARTATDPDREDKGVERYETSEGLKVEWLEQGRYRIIETGVTLECSHSEAP
jgi:hypothetical protein